MSALTAESARSGLLELLVRIAPDLDPQGIAPDVPFRDQFDFDSMDLFHFAVAVHERFGVDVPEKDYRQLLSLDQAIAYLLEHAR